MLLHTDFQPGMLVMVNDVPAKPLGRRAAAEAPHQPDVVLLARCVQVDDDPRFWHLSVQLINGREQLRRVRVLDILGVPASYLLAGNSQAPAV